MPRTFPLRTLGICSITFRDSQSYTIANMVQLWDVCMEDKSVLRNQGRHDSMTGMAVTFTAALCRCVHPFAALSIPLSQKAILKQNYGWLADFV